MLHKQIYNWFELYFPDYAGKRVLTWFPNGKDSIRVRQTNGQEFIFTYHGIEDWKLETVESFIKNLGKEIKK